MWERLRKLAGFAGQTAPLSPEGTTHTQPEARVVDVTDEDFAQVARAGELLVVVDFWAEWCAPCEVMSTHLGLLAEEFAGRLSAVALDVDENPETAEAYAIMGLPTLLFLCGGVEVDRQVGVTEYAELAARVTRLLDAGKPTHG
jgi:thioredoxin